MANFIGRTEELGLLRRLKKKSSASLVCLLGRRRIGKSSLIQEFAKDFSTFIEIQGLGPSENSTNQNQLDHFAQTLSEIFDKKKSHFIDWDEALHELAKLTQGKKVLILLDEISWMGRGDPLFASKIKSAWDTKFKKNPNLILVLCGSVSSWISDHILKNVAFEGRISLEINLQQLTLPEINQFWIEKKFHMGLIEKMMILSVTGGVPKYLEEILKTESAMDNLIHLCFSPSGFLYNEYEKIFKEIFQRRSTTLNRIVQACLNKKLSPVEVAKSLRISQSSELTEAIHTLELSGFLSRDFYFKPSSGHVSKLSHLRVKDNYLRFYLRIIEPMKMSLEKGGKKIKSLSSIKGIDSLLGLQFENLILANRFIVHRELGLSDEIIVSSAPYHQKKTSLTLGACQIDLLIHTHLDVFFVCEFKCQKIITSSITLEVERKIKVLKIPKRSSVKPVLVYLGELHPEHELKIKDYFFKIIPFELFFK